MTSAASERSGCEYSFRVTKHPRRLRVTRQREWRADDLEMGPALGLRRQRLERTLPGCEVPANVEPQPH